MRYIKKKSAVKPITGSIVDTTNIDDKTTNTYSARVIDKMNTYSTEEQVIGTWRDGKPIYRKVIPFVTSSTLINFPIGINNLERITDFRGCADWFPINFSWFNQSENVAYYVSTQYRPHEDQIIHQCSKEYADLQAYAILEYTKTTD